MKFFSLKTDTRMETSLLITSDRKMAQFGLEILKAMKPSRDLLTSGPLISKWPS